VCTLPSTLAILKVTRAKNCTFHVYLSRQLPFFYQIILFCEYQTVCNLSPLMSTLPFFFSFFLYELALHRTKCPLLFLLETGTHAALFQWA
jgi:hypothetical protein